MITVRWDEVADACADIALVSYEIRTAHWIGGDDGTCESGYCRECCGDAVVKIKTETPGADVFVDGGWRIEEDGQRFCDACGVALDASFTDYAVESELEHFLDLYSFDITSPSDCHSLREMLLAHPWQGGKFSARLRRLAFKAIRQSLARAKAAPGADGGKATDTRGEGGKEGER